MVSQTLLEGILVAHTFITFEVQAERLPVESSYWNVTCSMKLLEDMHASVAL